MFQKLPFCCYFLVGTTVSLEIEMQTPSEMSVSLWTCYLGRWVTAHLFSGWKMASALYLMTTLPPQICLYVQREQGWGSGSEKWIPFMHTVSLHAGTTLDMSRCPPGNSTHPWLFPGGRTGETANFLIAFTLHSTPTLSREDLYNLKYILMCHYVMQTILTEGLMLWKHLCGGQQHSSHSILISWNYRRRHKGWWFCPNVPIGSTIWSRRNPGPSSVQHGFDQVVWPQACFI